MQARANERTENIDHDALAGELMLRVSRLSSAGLLRLSRWLLAEESREAGGGGQALRLVAAKSSSTAPR